MRIPSKGLAGFAKEISDQCFVSRNDRITRGSMFKNLYLTGDENGNPAIYNMTFEFIDSLASELYSPSELRFGVDFHGSPTVVDRAMGHAASSELNRHIRQGHVDTSIEQAVTWSLVKGKTFIKLLWSDDGYEPYLIQPEYMGVLREDIEQLDRQEAFVQSTYYTPERFAELIANFDDRDAIMRKVQKYVQPDKAGEGPDAGNKMKQVVLGGLYPYQGSSDANPQRNRGIVDWLGGPQPNLDPQVLKSLIRMDELWVWDDGRDDYTVIQHVGDDVIISGKDTHRNIFADMWDPDNTKKSIKSDQDNPLSGQHPFIEICPNPMDGYFWGRSECINIALLQSCITKRVNGINSLLRLQEDPPRYFRMGTSMKQQELSKLKKPGGYLVDTNPQSQPPLSLAPELPGDLWNSLHEYVKMFYQIGGFPPVMQGRGETGVRAQGHAEVLAHMASPRFKDRALLVERQVSSIGGLGLDMLKAKDASVLTAWIMPKDQTFLERILTRMGINPKGVEEKLSPDSDLQLPPVEGMKPVPFIMNQLPKNCKVTVSSHSSSPSLSRDTRALLFELFKLGAVSPEYLVENTNPPSVETVLEDLRRKQIAEAQFAEQHPELLEKKSKKKK